jgi:esterase/lipase superfamily enzyme
MQQHPGRAPIASLLPRQVSVATFLAMLLVLLSLAQAVAASHSTTVYVASTRLVDRQGQWSARPAEAMRYSVHQVAVPQGHRPGRISRYFRSEGALQFTSRSDFTGAIVSDAQREHGTSEVLVYVHGFENSFTESLSRAAQLDVDLAVPATTVLYAWPSANRLDRYEQDVAQVAVARRGLAELLDDLAVSAASRIVIVAHSLGARLALETLSGMAAEGSPAFFGKFGGLAMLAPDIPVEDFNGILRSAPSLAGHIVIYGSSRDRVFQIAPAIAGITRRIGDLREIEGVGDAEVIVVDVGEVFDHAAFNHFPVVTSPTLIHTINSLPRPDLIEFARALARGALSDATVSAVGAATLVVLPSPRNR